MLSEIKGFLLLKNESFIYFFDSNKILKLSILVILLSYLAGAYQPFINDPNLNFSYTELLIKFIVLLMQGAFIISGFYFLGITFFASNKRVGLSSNNEIINDENYKILTIRRIFQLISFSQLPVIFGLIFTFIGINTFPGSVGFFIFINTILLISLYSCQNVKDALSGKKYESLKPEDIVFLSLTEEKDFLSWFNSGKNPSSEWRFHQDIYKNKWEAKAIVHAHSPHATAVSTHGKSIPPFHYMIALAGGEDIRCSEYATFGTHELSVNMIKALKDRKACLMANHGQVAFGENLSKAFELAQEVENICHQYIIALKMGEPKNLSLAEMKKILEKVKNYKSS